MKTFEEETQDLQSQHEQVPPSHLCVFTFKSSSLCCSTFSSSFALSLCVSFDIIAAHLSLGTNHSESIQYEQWQTAEESGNSRRGEHTATGEQRSGRTLYTHTDRPLQLLCMVASWVVFLLHGCNESFKGMLIDNSWFMVFYVSSLQPVYTDLNWGNMNICLFPSPIRLCSPSSLHHHCIPLLSLSLCSWGSRWRDGQKEWVSWRRRWAGVRSPTARCFRMWPTRMSV